MILILGKIQIIRANILENNFDSPQITYVSQIKNNKKEQYIESERKIENDEIQTPFDNLEEIILTKDNIDNDIKLREVINSDRDKIINEKKEDVLENEKINENDEINDLKSSYPYAIMNKKKDLDSSLKYIFKERLTRSKINSNKYSNLSLPKLRTSYLFQSKNKNSNSRQKLSKSLSHSVNKTIKFKNKNSKKVKNNISTK